MIGAIHVTGVAEHRCMSRVRDGGWPRQLTWEAPVRWIPPNDDNRPRSTSEALRQKNPRSVMSGTTPAPPPRSACNTDHDDLLPPGLSKLPAQAPRRPPGDAGQPRQRRMGRRRRPRGVSINNAPVDLSCGLARSRAEPERADGQVPVTAAADEWAQRLVLGAEPRPGRWDMAGSSGWPRPLG
jgi:hypothetical protein